MVTPNWIKTHSNMDIARNQFNKPTSVFQTDTIIASILYGCFQFIKEQSKRFSNSIAGTRRDSLVKRLCDFDRELLFKPEANEFSSIYRAAFHTLSNFIVRPLSLTTQPTSRKTDRLLNNSCSVSDLLSANNHRLALLREKYSRLEILCKLKFFHFFPFFFLRE